MKKLLNSDWLLEQCSSSVTSSAKSVTPVQITHSSGLWLTERQKEFSKTIDVMQKEDETFVQKLRMRKIGVKKDLAVNPQLRIVFTQL